MNHKEENERILAEWLRDDPNEQMRYALAVATRNMREAVDAFRKHRFLRSSDNHLESRETIRPVRESHTHRKTGDPDWDEVTRDAVRDVAHKLFGEHTG